MRNYFLLLSLLLIDQFANGAKPIEVEIDSIVYQFDSDKTEFCVFDANKEIRIATIKDSIEYNGDNFAVTSFTRGALSGCKYLEEVSIPRTITNIADYTFSSCSRLKAITLPPTISNIGEWSFIDCSSLESIEFPESVTFIGKYAFMGCWSLNKVFFNGSVTIQDCAFFVADNLWHNGVLEEVYIPTLEDWLGMNFDSTFGASWSSPLGWNQAKLFVDNVLIEHLSIPESISSIKDLIFQDYFYVESLITSDSLESIGMRAFSGCSNLKTVELGAGLKEIYYGAFSGCQKLETVKVHSVTPPKLIVGYGIDGEYDAFAYSYPEYMTLHVPEGTKGVYENTDGWRDFGTIIDDLPNDSGVEEVFIDESEPIEIFNLNGVLVFSGIDDYKLSSGVYIFRQGRRSKKIVIK